MAIGEERIQAEIELNRAKVNTLRTLSGVAVWLAAPLFVLLSALAYWLMKQVSP